MRLHLVAISAHTPNALVCPRPQLADKALGTAGLAEVLGAIRRKQHEQREQHMPTALDAASNTIDALPVSSPGARIILHGLTNLRLAHNQLEGDLAAFVSLIQLVHLGAWTRVVTGLRLY